MAAGLDSSEVRPSIDRTIGGSDGGVPVPNESARLRTLCTDALCRALAADETPREAMQGVRPLLADACREARACGVHAEQLLVLLKSTWLELPQAGRIPRHEHARILARIITLCIDEYYRVTASS